MRGGDAACRGAVGQPQEAGVQDDRPAALERGRGGREQPLIGGLAHGRDVQAAARRRAAGLQRPEAAQALALDVGADARRAQGLQQILRQRRLAAARQAVRDEQRPRPRHRAAHRQVDVAAHRLQGLVVLGAGGLPGPHQRDLGAHQGAVHQVVAEHAQAFVVAAGLEVGVDEAVRQRRQPVGLQVHRHEGDVAHDVDPAQARIELDAVEHQAAAGLARDVAQVQVAVALAHPSGGQALRDHGLQARVGLGLPALQPLERGAVERAGRHKGRRRQQLAQAVAQRGPHLRRRAPGALRRGHGRALVEAGQPHGQLVHVGRAQLAACGEAVPQAVLVEGAHAHRDVEHRAVAAQAGPVVAAGHRHHVQVGIGRQPAVQPQFLGAGRASPRQRRLVEVRGGQRLLDLVGEAAVQQHVRDVRLDVAHRRAVLPQPLDQRGHQPALPLGRELGRRPRWPGQRIGLARGHHPGAHGVFHAQPRRVHAFGDDGRHDVAVPTTMRLQISPAFRVSTMV